MYVYGCNLRFLARKNFKDMKQLTVLSLASNEIEELLENVFWELTSLKWLDIGENQLKALPSNLLANAPYLEEIYAYRNRLKHLDGNLFKNNLRLERIELDYNKIETIENLNVFRFRNLRVICIRYNICVSKRFPDDGELFMIADIVRRNCSENKFLYEKLRVWR